MIAGERQRTVGSTAYRKDRLYPFAKAFTEAAQSILTVENYDLFAEPKRALRNSGTVDALKEFFVNDYIDEGSNLYTAEDIEDLREEAEAQFDNDVHAILNENTYQSEYSPMIGMALPIHKLILMNNVFSQGGGIQKATAVAPSFTISLERRILVKPDGTEIDMFLQQNEIADAIDSTLPMMEYEVSLPEIETTDFIAKLGGTSMDELSVESHICGVYIPNVYVQEGDVLPDADGWFSNKGEVATAATAGFYNMWYRVNVPFTPTYGGPNHFERVITKPVTIKYKKNAAGDIEVLTDSLYGSLNKNKLTLTSIRGSISKVMFAARLNASNAMHEEVSVRWKLDTDYVEIPEARPINTTVSPEEVKDVAALYDANQVTKIMSMTKTALSEYKDMKIKRFLDEDYMRMDERTSFRGSFDFAPPEGYALDWVTFRHATFMDYFDDFATKMFQVLNDPNMTVTIYGDPRIVRKITPTEYTYQTPANIGPVTLDYTQTVVDTKDQRVYNFVGSDKLRDTNELMVILNPRNSDRICYRIYDYQLYISNEIRNIANPALPAIHAFERWKILNYQATQGRIQIVNPSGIAQE